MVEGLGFPNIIAAVKVTECLDPAFNDKMEKAVDDLRDLNAISGFIAREDLEPSEPISSTTLIR
jgi:hypothetical protein